jgi:hypothetical protein
VSGIKASFKIACGCTGMILCAAACFAGFAFLFSLGNGWHWIFAPVIIFIGYFFADLILEWATNP